jgi:hypothetical protein
MKKIMNTDLKIIVGIIRIIISISKVFSQPEPVGIGWTKYYFNASILGKIPWTADENTIFHRVCVCLSSSDLALVSELN